MGVLIDTYPSFYQFRYFYRKTKKMQNFYISRDGLKSHQRNNRPLTLTGEGVQEFDEEPSRITYRPRLTLRGILKQSLVLSEAVPM